MRKVALALVAMTVGVAWLGLQVTPAYADGETWDDLRNEVLLHVPSGPFQADLLAAVDVIEFLEPAGTLEERLAAYETFIYGVGDAFDAAAITHASAESILGTMEVVSTAMALAIDFPDLDLKIRPGKKCKFGSCTAKGKWCVWFGWDYDDGQQQSSGSGCYSR